MRSKLFGSGMFCLVNIDLIFFDESPWYNFLDIYLSPMFYPFTTRKKICNNSTREYEKQTPLYRQKMGLTAGQISKKTMSTESQRVAPLPDL